MIDTYNNSLVEQFAQVRDTLRNHHDSGCFVYLSSGACDCGVEPNTASLAALSSIERHVQDMARWIDTVMAQGGPVTSDYEEGERLLARLGQLGKEPSDG